AGSLHADVLNANLTLRGPDQPFLSPGDQLVLQLTLTDENNQPLRADQNDRNGLTLLQLWISGPSDEYRSVAGYNPLVIIDPQNGFDRNAGFNAATGEITFTVSGNIAGSGSFTALFKTQRLVNNTTHTVYVRSHFQVNQSRPTHTRSQFYLSCANCHHDLTHHDTNDFGNCVVCHARDSGRPFNGFIHNYNHSHQIRDCTNCHTAVGGVSRYSRTACFTCHAAPNSHRNYQDNQCSGCHTGNNSVYSRHGLATPQQPAAFNLTSPDDRAEFHVLSADFSWQASRDNDANDRVVYYVEIARDANFDNMVEYYAGEATQLHVEGLTDDMNYWWQVHAVDRNTNGRWSSQNRTFTTSFPEPPSPFNLTAPADGDSVGEDGSYEVNLSWEAAVDPDPGSVVQYITRLQITGNEVRDTTLVYPPVADTHQRLNPMNLLGIGNWDRPITVEWSVTAASEGDQVSCNSPFTFILRANPVGVSDRQNQPLARDYNLAVYPNPFNAVLNVRWETRFTGNNVLTLSDVTGKQSWVLADGWRDAGAYSLTREMGAFPAGVYLLSLNAGGRTQAMAKVVLIK
ncbi:MAG: hypothetical protein V2A61_02180, partial [Calditrichota bacterium]